MVTVDTHELKRFLNWRIRTRACNSTQACQILGIKHPSLIAMRQRGDIKGEKWDGEWWYPLAEVQKNIIRSGEKRRGRPRSGVV